MANSVISDIKQFMLQADLTNVDRIESLMHSYTEIVREYNDLCQHIRELIKNNLIEELEAYLKELDPSLQERYKELCQKEVREFTETAELYGFEMPVVEKVFDEISLAILGNMGLKPLLNRYRQIARSSDIREKLKVIRQILSLNPEDASVWEQNLFDYEDELKSQLEDAAKEAILSKDYTQLKQVHETILEEPWKNPFRENVIGRIEQELAAEELRARVKNCEQIIEFVEIMLKKPGKVDEVASAMDRLNELMAPGDVQLSSEVQEKMFVVGQEFEKQRCAKEAEENYARLLFELEQLMAHEASVEQVDSTFYELQKTRMQIPELTCRRVEAYRQNKIMKQKRKKAISLLVSVVIIVALLAVGVQVFKMISQKKAVSEYSARLLASINDAGELSDSGFEILKEIDDRVPFIRDAGEIVELVDKLNAKRKNEEDRRLKFKEMHLELTKMLENYGENSEKILVQLKEIQGVALPEHKDELESLNQLHAERRGKYIRAQDATYRRLCGEAGDAFMSLKAQMSKGNFDLAKEFVPQIEAKLQEAEKLADVTFEAKDGMKNLVSEYSNAANMLEQGMLDNSVGNALKEYENKIMTLTQLITEQNIEEARAFLSELGIEEMKLSSSIGNASIALRNDYALAQNLLKSQQKRLDALPELIEEENQALTKVLRESSWKTIIAALDEFKKTYPNYYGMGELGYLRKEVEIAISGKIDKYDANISQKAHNIEKGLKQLGVVVYEEILKMKEDFKANPIYTVSIKTKNQMNRDATYDFYFKNDTPEGTLKDLIEKRLLRKVVIKNVMGFGKSNRKLLFDFAGMNVSMGDNPPVKMSLEYPSGSMLENCHLYMDQSNFLVGNYGQWLVSLNKENLDFTAITGWKELENGIYKLLRNKSDCIRSVFKLAKFLDIVIKKVDDFALGEDFRITELLELRQALDDVIAKLPKDSQWYSVTWEKSDDLGLFYKTLNIKNENNGNCFLNLYQRLNKEKQINNRKLLPLGIVMVIKDKEDTHWRMAVKERGLKQGKYSLYVLDHEHKTSREVGWFNLEYDNWSWDLNDKASLPHNFNLVYVKK
ncbi:MAG: hypothetical protein IJS08_06115 [Victivallales bacterium]|nr:hypothetical protein [Victivallales bacterium]